MMYSISALHLKDYANSCIYKWIYVLIVLVFGFTTRGFASNSFLSKWDEGILDAKIYNVHIEADSMKSAFRAISAQYLVRMNLYMDAISDSDSTAFSFNHNEATGKELIEAFVTAYPAYTYTQDIETGVIWVHSKKTKYDDMLNEKVRIKHQVYQIPAQDAVLIPLGRLLSEKIFSNFPRNGQSFDYGVDLPSGIYSYKEILNFCSIGNPTKAFKFAPTYGGMGSVLFGLGNANPLAPPRPGAVRFWEVEIGKSTNGIPSAAEVGVAMADTNPRERWAARCYFEAANINYRWTDVVEKSGISENKVWAALGIEAAIYRGIGDPEFLVANVAPGFTTNLTQISDPGLALVTSLELAREKQSTNYLYLDTIVSQHKFTETEIASIKPDVYRLARETPLAFDKLKAMKLDVPEFSPKALDELADTNLFTLIPADKN